MAIGTLIAAVPPVSKGAPASVPVAQAGQP